MKTIFPTIFGISLSLCLNPYAQRQGKIPAHMEMENMSHRLVAHCSDTTHQIPPESGSVVMPHLKCKSHKSLHRYQGELIARKRGNASLG